MLNEEIQGKIFAVLQRRFHLHIHYGMIKATVYEYLNKAVSSILWPVLKIFFVLVIETKSWVRGRVLSLQHSFFWSEVFVYHDSPSIKFYIVK